MPTINAVRLLQDLQQLRSFGACEKGVVRLSFSEADMRSRRWLVERMGDAGLDARLDGVGNVFGRSKATGRALLMGSHSDTQPRGGWLDGALGVIYGLEIARALSEDPTTKHLPLDVGSWIDEEGTYLDCLGAHSFVQTMSDDQIRQTANARGETVGDVIRSVGLAGIPPARMQPVRHGGYLESHIEQGPFLEAQGKRIGIVTAIVGTRTFWLTFKGEQNHAGTTPMHMRKDAGDALIRFAHRIQETLRLLSGERTVFTITRVTFDPGMDGVVPGLATMNLQFRDCDDSRLDRMEEAVHELIGVFNEQGPVKVTIVPRPGNEKPSIMDARFQEHLVAAADRHAPDSWIRMPSGAAHDAQIFAKRMPAAMLFVPSIGGVSHDFAEDTDEEDIVLGCQIMATATASILRGINAQGSAGRAE
jgi:N-carbamoyl-L-amino-acid hydrolase